MNVRTSYRSGSVNFGVPLEALVPHLRGLGTPSWLANRVELGLLALIVATLKSLVFSYRTRVSSTSVLPLT